jgi:tRNA pseudouridine13 synthase
LFRTAPPPFDDSALLRALPLTSPVAHSAVVFRAQDDGFVVDELPAYLPSGAGEHLYLLIEKRALSTSAVVLRLKDAFGLHERDIGYAGRKDERGVTRQWLSVPARSVEPRLQEKGLEHAKTALGFAILLAKRHGNKLRLGHLRGNRFTILLDGDIDVTALRARCAEVEGGVPNLFGAQRFGIDGSTLGQAMRFLLRHRPARSRRDEMLVSAVQSSLFNAWLTDRVDDGTWNAPLDGDVLEKTLNGAPFLCIDPIADGPRLLSGEICVAGPMLGASMRPAEREAATRESRSWEKAGLDLACLLSHPAFSTGVRRGACLRPTAIEVSETSPEPRRVGLRFSLPKGAYASLVLRAIFGAALLDAAFADGAVADRLPPVPPTG